MDIVQCQAFTIIEANPEAPLFPRYLLAIDAERRTFGLQYLIRLRCGSRPWSKGRMIFARGRRVDPLPIKLALLVVDALARSHGQAIDLDDLQIFGHFSAKIERICVVVQIMMICQAKIEPALHVVSLSTVHVMEKVRKSPLTNVCSCHSRHQWRMPRAQRQQKSLQEDREREFVLEPPDRPSILLQPAA